MSDPVSDAFMDAQIFEDLQSSIDADAEVREQIKTILQKLERQGRSVHSILSRAHSTPPAQREFVLFPALRCN
jgi:hypothetical protein